MYYYYYYYYKTNLDTFYAFVYTYLQIMLMRKCCTVVTGGFRSKQEAKSEPFHTLTKEPLTAVLFHCLSTDDPFQTECQLD